MATSSLRNSGLSDLKASFGRQGGPLLTNKFLLSFAGINAGNNSAWASPMMALMGGASEGLNDLSIFVDTMTLPGKIINPVEYTMWDKPYQLPSQMTSDDFSVEFYVTSNGILRFFFKEWINWIINDEDQLLRYYDEYVCDAVAVTHNTSGDPNYKYTLTGVYPLSFGGYQLSTGTTEVVKLSVKFAYHKIKEEILYPTARGGSQSVVDELVITNQRRAGEGLLDENGNIKTTPSPGEEAYEDTLNQFGVAPVTLPKLDPRSPTFDPDEYNLVYGGRLSGELNVEPFQPGQSIYPSAAYNDPARDGAPLEIARINEQGFGRKADFILPGKDPIAKARSDASIASYILDPNSQVLNELNRGAGLGNS